MQWPTTAGREESGAVSGTVLDQEWRQVRFWGGSTNIGRVLP